MSSKRVILFHYTLTDSNGRVLDSTTGESPMAFLEGAGQVLPGLEKALLKLSVGDKRRVELSPPDAYGYRDLRKVMMVPRAELPQSDIAMGALFRPSDESGLPYRVTEIDDVFVTLDGNHPMAGFHLVCDVEVVSMRPATPEELDHGHAHSDDGGHTH